MAFGFFKKLGDIAKKVGSGIKKVASKVWQVAKPIADTVMPIVGTAGGAKGAAVQQIYQHAAPIADYLLGSR